MFYKILKAAKTISGAIQYFLLFGFKDLNRFKKIPTHLTVEEKINLHKLSQSFSSPVIVEIGSYLGASANVFGLNVQNNGKLICIDTWENQAMSEGKRDTLNLFKQNTSHLNNLVMVKGYSQDVVEEIKSITLYCDVLFIDGDHSFEGVKRDWELYKKFLKKGSIVVFHDYGWADGVKKVVEHDVMPLVEKSKFSENMWWGWIR
jgi:predicted O-methyltransferase YrrM